MRGTIDQLPSGGYRVRVSAGTDPLTKRRLYLTEVVPAGPTAWKQAERIRTRLLRQVDEGKQPRTKASVNQLLDRYLATLDVDPNTEKSYRGYIERHLRPALGDLSLTQVRGETLDGFYGELRRCRRRCKKQVGLIDHRIEREHECNAKCRPHVCKPLAASSVRQMHWILSAAFERGVRWDWIGVSPVAFSTPPPAAKPNPAPPTPEQAAAILNEAWKDPAWGLLLWVAMTVGARRGELCALRRCHIDWHRRVLLVPKSVSGTRETLREKETKTHQQRRLGLDETALTLLREHLDVQDARASALGFGIAQESFLFSDDPNCGRPLLPDTVTQRYRRMVDRLGIDTTLHKLRHYNATELIAAGVDLRTVAHRLGHGGGGVTTLKTYAAWVESADHAAAATISGAVPAPPRPGVPLPS